MVSKNNICKNALKYFSGTKDSKIAAMLLIDSNKFKIETIPPPIPEVIGRYYICKQQRDFLKKNGLLEAFKNLISKIIKITYLELSNYHALKGRKELYPKRNVISEEISYEIMIEPNAGQAQNSIVSQISEEISSEIIIQSKAYQPNSNEMIEKVNILIENIAGNDYSKYIQIYKELVANRFLDKKTGNIIYPFNSIEKYLKRREKQIPREIKCKYCKHTVYVFHPKKIFCYRPSCKSSQSRKDAKSF